ncbi:hypothetical protein [Sphingobium subterraneum]|uniref:Uncharacterized protein n=1 Tax=Sphingobium subterraneum TaxID=627688 RepID=A0A841J0P8_9SPHN|nr:hypothetical protein [Sphingobium subterraneum]MBB6123922.1 hypothetical protein [Sphingobium subterraneum]
MRGGPACAHRSTVAGGSAHPVDRFGRLCTLGLGIRPGPFLPSIVVTLGRLHFGRAILPIASPVVRVDGDER